MDLTKIKQYINLLHENNLEELEVSDGDFKIKLKAAQSNQVVSSTTAPSLTVSGPVASSQTVKDTTVQGASKAQVSPDKLVKSPFVGTFYEAPSPDVEPFVKIGQKVKKGDTLCIVEAMKLMNEIEAEKDGVIKEILVNNSEPVEFDQALFILEFRYISLSLPLSYTLS